MKQEIVQELKKLEQEKGFKILYAVESGSRAWGFASQNSDWDVRFIYIHPKDWYLEIDQNKDNYNKILENDIDLSGWDLQKTLKLLRKSNPPLLEWLNSSIVYVENDSFLKGMKELAIHYFNPKSCMHHYLSMAHNNYNTYLKEDMVIMKKYFYVLRSILAAEYIMKHQKIAPLEFKNLLAVSKIPDDVFSEIQIILEKKRNSIEKDLIPSNKILNSYIELKMNELDKFLSSFIFKQQRDSQLLNEFFIQEVNQE
jgi:predicted nucleotidyltransferase